VTFQLNLEDKDSFVYFGGIPDGIIEGDSHILHVDRNDNTVWWVAEITDIKYNATTLKQSSIAQAIFDSG